MQHGHCTGRKRERRPRKAEAARLAAIGQQYGGPVCWKTPAPQPQPQQPSTPPGAHAPATDRSTMAPKDFATLADMMEWLESGGFVSSARVPNYWSNGVLSGTPYAFQGQYFFVFDPH